MESIPVPIPTRSVTSLIVPEWIDVWGWSVQGVPGPVSFGLCRAAVIYFHKLFTFKFVKMTWNFHLLPIQLLVQQIHVRLSRALHLAIFGCRRLARRVTRRNQRRLRLFQSRRMSRCDYRSFGRTNIRFEHYGVGGRIACVAKGYARYIGRIDWSGVFWQIVWWHLRPKVCSKEMKSIGQKTWKISNPQDDKRAHRIVSEWLRMCVRDVCEG